MKKLSLALLLATPIAYADTYQFEINAAYSETELDDLSVETETYGVAGTYYLAPVDTDKGPLAEAAFQSRSSSISIGYLDIEEEDTGVTTDGDSYAIGGRYVAQSGLIFDATYQEGDVEDVDFDVVSVGIGSYVGKNSTLVATYIKADDDAGAAEFESGSLNFKTLVLMDQQAVNIELGVALVNPDGSDDSYTELTAGTDYYFNKQTSIGLTLNSIDDGDDEGWGWAISGEHFINENVAVSASYGMFEIDSDTVDDDEDGFSIGVRVRF